MQITSTDVVLGFLTNSIITVAYCVGTNLPYVAVLATISTSLLSLTILSSAFIRTHLQARPAPSRNTEQAVRYPAHKHHGRYPWYVVFVAVVLLVAGVYALNCWLDGESITTNGIVEAIGIAATTALTLYVFEKLNTL